MPETVQLNAFLFIWNRLRYFMIINWPLMQGGLRTSVFLWKDSFVSVFHLLRGQRIKKQDTWQIEVKLKLDFPKLSKFRFPSISCRCEFRRAAFCPTFPLQPLLHAPILKYMNMLVSIADACRYTRKDFQTHGNARNTFPLRKVISLLHKLKIVDSGVSSQRASQTARRRGRGHLCV